MLKKTYFLSVIIFIAVSNFLFAETEYDIHDIGTLNTSSSGAIALNNQGQILGWYNIDGSSKGKHFFLRDGDGSFYEVPVKENGMGPDIDWRYLIDDGRVYGTLNGNILYMWNRYNGVTRLCNIPGEISAINNAGQVLIMCADENENGKLVRRPIILDNGKITKLNGLEGNVGIPSEESYGLGMNNFGEVVGTSLTSFTYKNKIYKMFHAVKWVNGKAIDLHEKIPKTNSSVAIAINDNEDVLISEYLKSDFFDLENPEIKVISYDLTSEDLPINYRPLYFLCREDVCLDIPHRHMRINNSGYTYSPGFFNVLTIEEGVYKSNWRRVSVWISKDNGVEITDGEGGYVTSTCLLNHKIQQDLDSIWMRVKSIISVNDKGEVIAEGETIYGEKHAMFLTPVKS